MMKTRIRLLIAFCLALGMVLLVLGLRQGCNRPGASVSPAVPEPTVRLPSATATAAAGAAGLQEAFADTVERTMPGVVLVTSRKRVGVASPADYRRSRIEYKDVPSGQGSGFFIRPDGYILTNHHVVRNQDSFFVTLNDGSEYAARVVGADPPSDLALLKVDADRQFHVLAFADVEKVRIGHWAIAIGAPFSLSRSVTVGVVSGMKRSGVGVNIHESYIQTDTSINPGNSGGPLLNLAGEVIGVNDFILSPSGGSIGISFAISADLAKYVAGELVDKGHVSRPWLGVVFEPLSREVKTQLKLDSGVAVSQVFRDSPAAKALRRGDVILEAEGEAVHAPSDLQTRILSSAPGDELTLKIWRGGESRTEKVRLEPSPPDWFRRASGSSRPDMLAAGE